MLLGRGIEQGGLRYVFGTHLGMGAAARGCDGRDTEALAHENNKGRCGGWDSEGLTG